MDEFDKLLDDGDSGNELDFDFDAPPSDREVRPTVPLEIGKGIMDTFTDDPKNDQVADVAAGFIPAVGLGTNYNEMLTAKRGIEASVKDSVDSLRTTSAPLVNTLSEFLPKDSFLQKYIRKEGHETSGQAIADQSFDIGSSLFNGLEEQKKMLLEQTAVSTNATVSGNNKLITLLSITGDISSKFYRKSLEYQHKQLLESTAMHKTMGTLLGNAVNILRTINHGVSMPDYVKLKGSEAAKAIIRERAISTMFDKMDGSGFGANIATNFKNMSQQWLQNSSAAIEMGTEISSSIQDSSDMLSEEELREMGVTKERMIASSFGEDIRRYLGLKLGEQASKIRGLDKYRDKVDDFFFNANGTLARKADEAQSEDKRIQYHLFDFFRKLTNDDRYLTNTFDSKSTDPTEARVFDTRIYDSISKVIPRLLGKIVTLLGGTDTTWDFGTGQFVKGGNEAHIKAQFKAPVLQGGMRNNIEVMKSDLNLNSTQVSELVDVSSNTAEQINKHNYKTIDGLSDEVREALGEVFEGGDTEKARALSELLKDTRNVSTGYSKRLEEFHESGMADDLVEQGILIWDPVENRYVTDGQKFRAYMKNVYKEVADGKTPEMVKTEKEKYAEEHFDDFIEAAREREITKDKFKESLSSKKRKAKKAAKKAAKRAKKVLKSKKEAEKFKSELEEYFIEGKDNIEYETRRKLILAQRSLGRHNRLKLKTTKANIENALHLSKDKDLKESARDTGTSIFNKISGVFNTSKDMLINDGVRVGGELTNNMRFSTDGKVDAIRPSTVTTGDSIVTRTTVFGKMVGAFAKDKGEKGFKKALEIAKKHKESLDNLVEEEAAKLGIVDRTYVNLIKRKVMDTYDSDDGKAMRDDMAKRGKKSVKFVKDIFNMSKDEFDKFVTDPTLSFSTSANDGFSNTSNSALAGRMQEHGSAGIGVMNDLQSFNMFNLSKRGVIAGKTGLDYVNSFDKVKRAKTWLSKKKESATSGSMDMLKGDFSKLTKAKQALVIKANPMLSSLNKIVKKLTPENDKDGNEKSIIGKLIQTVKPKEERLNGFRSLLKRKNEKKLDDDGSEESKDLLEKASKGGKTLLMTLAMGVLLSSLPKIVTGVKKVIEWGVDIKDSFSNWFDKLTGVFDSVGAKIAGIGTSVAGAIYFLKDKIASFFGFDDDAPTPEVETDKNKKKIDRNGKNRRGRKGKHNNGSKAPKKSKVKMKAPKIPKSDVIDKVGGAFTKGSKLGVAKAILKKVPLLGSIFEFGSAVNSLFHGRIKEAGISAMKGVVDAFPVGAMALTAYEIVSPLVENKLNDKLDKDATEMLKDKGILNKDGMEVDLSKLGENTGEVDFDKGTVNNEPVMIKDTGYVEPKTSPRSRRRKGVTFKTSKISKQDRALLERIAKGESKVGRAGYEVVFGMGKYGKPKKKLTDMTINEVIDFQRSMLRRGSGSTAIGKYQFLKKVLLEEVKYAGISRDTIFTPEVQDMLIMNRLRRFRGYDKYKRGEIGQDKFIQNLSMEFASIEDPALGHSHYGQGMHTTAQSLRFVLDGKTTYEDLLHGADKNMVANGNTAINEKSAYFTSGHASALGDIRSSGNSKIDGIKGIANGLMSFMGVSDKAKADFDEVSNTAGVKTSEVKQAKEEKAKAKKEAKTQTQMQKEAKEASKSGEPIKAEVDTSNLENKTEEVKDVNVEMLKVLKSIDKKTSGSGRSGHSGRPTTSRQPEPRTPIN